MKYINNYKLNQIQLDNNNYYVAVDFDRTITSRQSCGSWNVFRSVLKEEYEKENVELYNKYAPIELDYTISVEQKSRAMEEWYYKNMQLFYDYNLTKSKMENATKNSNLTFRPGAKEFLKQLHDKSIPVIIVSAGIGNVIEQFLKDNDSYYDNIYIISNFISFNEDGNIKSYTYDLIHTLNKSMKGHMSKKLEEDISGREFRLLFGDFIEDKNMVPMEEWDKTISVGFLDKNIEENLNAYRNNFDIVLTSEDASFNTFKDFVKF